MRKMFFLLVCTIFVYGAGVQGVQIAQATPGMQIDLKKLNKAKFIKYEESKPAQFTIKVPVDLESAYARKSKDGTLTARQNFYILCFIGSSTDRDVLYRQEKQIEAGHQTVTFKFNNIKRDDVSMVNRYVVYLMVKVMEDDGLHLFKNFRSVKELKNYHIRGSI